MAGGWTTINGEPRYRVQSGDTLSTISKRYLGSAGRYMEIWNAQPSTRTAGKSPNNIIAGEALVMPLEAVDNARALGMLAAASSSSPAPSILPTPAQAASAAQAAADAAAHLLASGRLPETYTGPSPTPLATTKMTTSTPQQVSEQEIGAMPFPIQKVAIAGAAAAALIGLIAYATRKKPAPGLEELPA